MRLNNKEIIHSTIFCIMFCFSIQTFAQNIQFQYGNEFGKENFFEDLEK